MRRLVKTRAKQLSKEKTADLMQMVKDCFEKHEDFYKQAEKDRKQFLRADIGTKDDPRISVNFEASFVRSTVPSIYFQDPKLKALPGAPNQAASSENWDDLLSAIVERTGYTPWTKSVILDAAVYSEGWKKFIYTGGVETEVHSGEENLDEKPPDFVSEDAKQGGTPWDNITAPQGVRISPLHVATDCPHRTLDGSRFIAIRYKKRLNELIADPLYPNITKASTQEPRNQGGGSLRSGGVGIQTAERELPRDEDGDDWVWLYEVWVNQLVDYKLYRQLVVLVEDFDTPVRKILGWEQLAGEHLTGWPINKLELLEVPDGRQDTLFRAWAPISRALNIVVSRLVGMTSRMGQKYAISKQRVSKPDDAKEALTSNEPVAVVEVNEGSVNEAVAPIPNSPVPQDVYSIVQILLSLQTQVSGLSQNQRGSSGVRTAREASIIDQNVQIRISELVDKVSSFIKRDAEIMVRMLRSAIAGAGSKVYEFRRTGNVGKIKWGQFTAEDANWSPDVRVEPNSFRKAQEDEEIQKYIQIIGIASQLVAIYPNIRLDTLFGSLLKKLDIPEADQIVASGEDQEKLQWQELMGMMLSGEPLRINDTDDDNAHIRVIDEALDMGLLSPQVAQVAIQHRQFHEARLEHIKANQPNVDISGSVQNLSGVPNSQAGPGSDVQSAGPSQIGGGL